MRWSWLLSLQPELDPLYYDWGGNHAWDVEEVRMPETLPQAIERWLHQYGPEPWPPPRSVVDALVALHREELPDVAAEVLSQRTEEIVVAFGAGWRRDALGEEGWEGRWPGTLDWVTRRVHGRETDEGECHAVIRPTPQLQQVNCTPIGMSYLVHQDLRVHCQRSSLRRFHQERGVFYSLWISKLCGIEDKLRQLTRREPGKSCLIACPDKRKPAVTCQAVPSHFALVKALPNHRFHGIAPYFLDSANVLRCFCHLGLLPVCQHGVLITRVMQLLIVSCLYPGRAGVSPASGVGQRPALPGKSRRQ